MQLVYEATFYEGTPKPIFGHDLGPLKETKPHIQPGTAELKAVNPRGLQLRLARTKAADDTAVTDPCVKVDDCYIGAVINPFPEMEAFKIRATFELPRWESPELPQSRGPADYTWAMVVFARQGDADYQPARWERTTVTLQSRRIDGTHSAQMNTPCGARPGTRPYTFDTPYPSNSSSARVLLPEGPRAEIFDSTEAERSRVTIELLIDRTGEVARASVEVPACHYSVRRWFINPNIAGELKGPIDSVGFAIGNASGLADLDVRHPAPAIASVIIHDFSVYQLNKTELLFLKGGAWFDGLRTLIGRVSGLLRR